MDLLTIKYRVIVAMCKPPYTCMHGRNYLPHSSCHISYGQSNNLDSILFVIIYNIVCILTFDLFFQDCGNVIYNPKSQTCCCGKVYDTKSNWNCCGYYYYNSRTSKCCNYYSVKSKHMNCPRHKIE